MAIIVPILDLFLTVPILFACCELAGRMSCEFDDIKDLIGQFDWYLFPLKIQQTLPVVIMNEQEPVGFACFGSFMCNRDTFKKVSVVRWQNRKTVCENTIWSKFDFFRWSKLFFHILWHFVEQQLDNSTNFEGVQHDGKIWNLQFCNSFGNWYMNENQGANKYQKKFLQLWIMKTFSRKNKKILYHHRLTIKIKQIHEDFLIFFFTPNWN